MFSFWRSAVLILFACFLILSANASDELAALREMFRNPPPDSRILTRWWWFGPSQTKTELERELAEMKRSGIGGVEIQPVYPVELDHASDGFRNYPYLSDEFIDALRFANTKAHELGLRVDLTLGSGWPYGGPHIAPSQAAGMLRCESVPIDNDQESVVVPFMTNAEQLIAVFLAPRNELVRDEVVALDPVPGPRLSLPKKRPGDRRMLFFISSRTGMMVKRPAIGAEGFVLDHFNRDAINTHLRVVADRLMQAFGDKPPYSVFSDSLEVYGADWTPDLLDEFRKRRGYDLKPYLPALVSDFGPSTGDVRNDWGRTLTELINERYLTPVREWAAQHGTRFRAQVYGPPAVTLSSNAFVDLPEGEGYTWKAFSNTRWASSANHLYGNAVTSSETWTWLHSPAFRATPLDMKAEADEFFLEGSNQIIAHGWPYSPPEAGEPGWRFYAAASFNDHTPWWPVMRDVSEYLQRASWILRQGKPVNDVAVLLPTEDARANFHARFEQSAGLVAINDQMPALLGPNVVAQIEDAGFNVDFIDSEAINKVGIHYAALVLPRIERLPLEAYRLIEQYAESGGVVLAIGRTPTKAPGRVESKRDSQEVIAISDRLFQNAAIRSRLLANDTDLGASLSDFLKADLKLSPAVPAIGFVHRKLDSADIYFIVNTGNHPVRTVGIFRGSAPTAELWNLLNGEITPIADAKSLNLTLAPYESQVIVFTHRAEGAEEPALVAHGNPNRMLAPPTPLDLSADWIVDYKGLQQSVQMPRLHSWAEDTTTKFYSGQAVYKKKITITGTMLRNSEHVVLYFGEGTPVDPPPDPPQTGRPRNRAWLEGPVREAATVSVNGETVGSVWHPPYELEVTSFVHTGTNDVEITVGNLAINGLAGSALPDNRLLDLRFTKRFDPQDMQGLEPLPSGLLGPVQLVFR